MTTVVAAMHGIGALEKVLIAGDLSSLTPEERVFYYQKVCESIGLNPLTKPFDYLELNKKLVLYANRGCSDQLRFTRSITLHVVSRETVGDVFIVTSRAIMPDGREDESIGAVSIAGLRGEFLANAFMKSETKSKRRVTLSICGLSFSDESEVDSIAGAERVQVDENGVVVAAVTATKRERPAVRATLVGPAQAPQQAPQQTPEQQQEEAMLFELADTNLEEMLVRQGVNRGNVDALLASIGRPPWAMLNAQRRADALIWLEKQFAAQRAESAPVGAV